MLIEMDKEVTTNALIRCLNMALENGRLALGVESIASRVRFDDFGNVVGYTTYVALAEEAPASDEGFVRALITNWGSWVVEASDNTLDSPVVVTGMDARYYYELWYVTDNVLVDSGEDTTSPWELAFTPDLPGVWRVIVLESNGTRSASIDIVIEEV